MRNKLSLAKRIQVWWIAICETRRISLMATMPIPDRGPYAQTHVLEDLKQPTLAASAELSAGRRPYDSINAIVDAAILARIPEYRASLGVRF